MPTAKRWLPAGFCLASSLLALWFAGGLIADLYGRLSAEQRSSGGSNVAGISAARYALELQPWRTGFRSDLAWTLGVRGDAPAMRSQYRRALRWNPASAYLWIEYAQALARAHRIDAEYTLALSRATTLSHAGPVRMLGAQMGANHWSQGGEQDRSIWAQGMIYALRTAPYDFLWHVLRARREVPLCGYVGAELGLTRWCATVFFARRLCDSLAPGAKGATADECKRLGLAPDESRTSK